MKIFSEEISVFKNFNSEPKTITLGLWLKVCKEGSRYAEQVFEYRRSKDEQLKKSLPLATVGAVCKDGRKLENVITRTGWIALDIDAKDNPHLPDAEHLRDAVAKIQNVAFSALSTGGRGVWALVKVSQPERQAEHFEALQADFKAFGITLDSTKGKNPNDARFYSYDPGAVIKDSFTVYKKLQTKEVPLYQPPKKLQTPVRPRSGNVFENAVNFARERGFTFTPGCKKGGLHYSILVMSGYLNYYGVPRHEAETWIKSNITPDINSNCISWPYEKEAHKFGEGKRLQSQRVNHAPRRDSAGEPKIQSQDSAPHGFNPYTGEIFDSRGYPADWDEIEAPEPGTAEYAEAEYYRAMDADPILKQIDETFEPELITEQ